MRLIGEVLSVKPVPGGADYPPYLRATVLDRESETIVDARVGDQFGPVTPGEEIEAIVSVTPWRTRDGAAAVAYRLVSRIRPAAVSTPAAGQERKAG